MSASTETAAHPAYVESLDALRAEFRARGWDRPATGRVLVEMALHLLVMFGGSALFFMSSGWALKALGIVLAAVGSFGVATNTHTASHRATSSSRRFDSVLTYLGYPFLLGMGATYWHHKHVVVHHRAPNVYGVDDDIDVGPLFAILEPQRRDARGLLRGWYAVQWLFVPLAIGFNAFNMAWTSLRFLTSRLSDPKRRRLAHVLDVAALLAHAAVFGALLAAGLDPVEVLVFFVLRLVLLGYLLFAAFAPAHMPEEAVCLDARGRGREDYVAAVAATSLNFRAGALGRFLCSGVDFQIEHHLFPRYSHVYYARMAELVEDYCRHHGLPYRTIGWGEGIWKSLVVFVRPKRVVPLGPVTGGTR